MEYSNRSDVTNKERKCDSLKNIPKNKSVNLQFYDVTYKVPISKNILRGISGEFRAGELSAILGPSGSGKSTLLNILADYRIHLTSGQICINGAPRHTKEFRKISRYILQDDYVCPQFTVMETMIYASKFKLPNNTTDTERQNVIDGYLKVFLLRDKANTFISNISGGERKRLCIAMELLDNPSVLFLDEPTTGLDEFSASQCITLLKRLATSGRTIICSIHCPSARLFQMFDRVTVISSGQCIYQGPVDCIVPFLQKFQLNCPITYNPADYIIEVATNFHGNFHDKMVYEMNNGKRCEWGTPSKLEPSELQYYEFSLGEGASEENREWKTHWWSEYSWIFCRIMQQMWRDKSNIKLTMATNVGMSFILGYAYFGIGYDAPLGMFNYNLALLSVVQFVFLSLPATLTYIPQRIQYLRREHFNQWYRASSYFMALITCQIPSACVTAIIGSSLIYVLSGQPLQWFRFALFVGIIILTSATASSFGLFIGTRLRLLNALFIGPNFIAVFILFSTYAIERPNLNLLEQILMYSSFMRHSLEGAISALLKFDREDLICPSDIMFCLGKKPQFILKLTGTLNADYMRAAFSLLGFYILFTIMAWVTFKCRLSSLEFLQKNPFYRYGRYFLSKYVFVKAM
ncbi:ATP-binding cassette sub-family G member 1-like [Haematobia irritans]|uniref:ATP-binding cassette sub-family G member 1-like n=1 Tax=Haematobia irritans TaxID=7368 RepID=UPI003F4F6416